MLFVWYGVGFWDLIVDWIYLQTYTVWIWTLLIIDAASLSIGRWDLLQTTQHMTLDNISRE